MRTAFVSALLDAAANDPSIWLITGDLGYSVLEPFATRFPDRYVNAGVAEQNMVGLAAGLAASGATVFVYSIANFPTFRALEQMRNDVCYPGAAVTIVSVGSGFSYGAHGPTHHAIEDLAIMRALPGIVVVSPGDPTEAALATHALVARRGPGYLRLGKAGETVVESVDGDAFALGRLRLIRDGSDVTVLATGSILALADVAASMLSAEGISVRLYSAHTLRPFDGATLARAMAETAGLVTIEEHRLTGGLRSAVAESLLGNVTVSRGRMSSLGIDPDVHLPTGDQAYLRSICGLTSESIREAVCAILRSRAIEATFEPAREPRRSGIEQYQAEDR
jgi:transketolase